MHQSDSTSKEPGNETPAIDFSNIESVEEGCAKLGAYLGLDSPVTKDVFLSAAEDPTYANNLYLSRVEPAFLNQVLNQPTRQWPERGGQDGGEAPAPTVRRSTAELLGRAAKSFLKWTRTGFRKVDEATFRRRMNACQACPHYVEAPAKIVYSVANALSKTTAEQHRVCDLCGCLSAAKARFEHEFCPDDHPVAPGLTRWGEPQPS